MNITDEQDKRLIFKIPFLTSGLNGDDGLIRQHFRDAKKVKDRLHLFFLSQRPRCHKAIDFPVRITYIRYTSRFMDWDNAAASFKHIGDALQTAGILSDDSPNVIHEFIPKQIKCKIKEQRTEIIIESL